MANPFNLSLKFDRHKDHQDHKDIYSDIYSDIQDDNESDLFTRFKDLDLDSASQEEILSRLSPNDVERFNDLVDSREIVKLIPPYVPWWQTMNVQDVENLFIYTRKGGINLSFNLVEILFYYVLVSRTFNGDLDESAWEMIRLNCLVLKREKHAFTNLEQVLDSLLIYPKEKVDYYLEDVKRLLACNHFMIKSIQDLIKIASPKQIIKKLEYYSWLVSRQDVEFKSQIKNLVLGLSKKHHGNSGIQEL
jgi:hypothetical protein